MRPLVVGATGSLGRLAMAEAAQRGHDVTALVRDPARANLPEPVVKVRGDILDPVSLGPRALAWPPLDRPGATASLRGRCRR